MFSLENCTVAQGEAEGDMSFFLAYLDLALESNTVPVAYRN